MDLCSSEFLKTSVEIFLRFLFLRLRQRCIGCVSSIVTEPEICVLELANATAPFLEFFGGSAKRDLQDRDPRCVEIFFG